MLFSPVLQAYSSHSPASARPDSFQNRTKQPADDEPPRKPDWLLIMVGILFLLTLLIAWLVDVPVLGR